MNQKKIEISVIVPLFHGKNYIVSIIKQISKCVQIAQIGWELIFVNDAPDENLDYFTRVYCDNIKFIKNKYNIGIHASRIRGLQEAKGKYILFLDQDDLIAPEYFYSQLQCIEDADFCVCRLKNGTKEHYTNSFKMEEVITKDFMMNNWCSIVSPGQVLLKKSSIPEIWENNILKNNGADDYFLWLAMFGTKRKVKINNEILFCHRVTGFNTSSDTNLMMDSEIEMLEILKKAAFYSEEEKYKLENLKTSLRRIHLKQLDNIVVAYYVRDVISSVSKEEIKKICCGKIAIYGAADIGKGIAKSLRMLGIQVCLIDRNAKYITTDFPIYTIDTMPQDVSCAVITIRGSECTNIRMALMVKGIENVYSLREFVEEINKVVKKDGKYNCNGL